MDFSSVIIKLCVPWFYVYFVKVHCGCGVGRLIQWGAGDKVGGGKKCRFRKERRLRHFFFFIDSVNPWYYWIHQHFILAQKGAKEERESFAVSFLLLLHCSSVAFTDFLTVQAIRKTWTCLPFFFIFLLLMRVVSAFFRCCFSAFYCFMDLRLRCVVDKLVVDKWRVKRWCYWGCGYLRREGGARTEWREDSHPLSIIFLCFFCCWGLATSFSATAVYICYDSRLLLR